MIDLFAVLAPVVNRPAVPRTVYVEKGIRHGKYPAYVVSNTKNEELYAAVGLTDDLAKVQLFEMLRQFDRESDIVWVNMVPVADMGGAG